MLRKLCIVIALSLFTVLGWSSLSQPAQLSQDTQPIGNPQGAPYCGTTPSSFAVPLGQPCPETYDHACMQACYNSYLSQMVAAHDAACAAESEAWSDYDSSVDAIVDEFGDCMATATDPALAAACEQFAQISLDTALNNLDSALQSIDDDLEATKSQLDAECIACQDNCCRDWPNY